MFSLKMPFGGEDSQNGVQKVDLETAEKVEQAEQTKDESLEVVEVDEVKLDESEIAKENLSTSKIVRQNSVHGGNNVENSVLEGDCYKIQAIDIDFGVDVDLIVGAMETIKTTTAELDLNKSAVSVGNESKNSDDMESYHKAESSFECFEDAVDEREITTIYLNDSMDQSPLVSCNETIEISSSDEENITITMPKTNTKPQVKVDEQLIAYDKEQNKTSDKNKVKEKEEKELNNNSNLVINNNNNNNNLIQKSAESENNNNKKIKATTDESVISSATTTTVISSTVLKSDEVIIQQSSPSKSTPPPAVVDIPEIIITNGNLEIVRNLSLNSLIKTKDELEKSNDSITEHNYSAPAALIEQTAAAEHAKNDSPVAVKDSTAKHSTPNNTQKETNVAETVSPIKESTSEEIEEEQNTSNTSSTYASPSNAGQLNASSLKVNVSHCSPVTSNECFSTPNASFQSASNTSPPMQYTRSRLLNLRTNPADSPRHPPSPVKSFHKFDRNVLKERLRQFNLLREEVFFKNNTAKKVEKYAFRYKNNTTELPTRTIIKDQANDIAMWRSNFEVDIDPPVNVKTQNVPTPQPPSAKRETQKRDKKLIPFAFDTFSSWSKESSQDEGQRTQETQTAHKKPDRADVFFSDNKNMRPSMPNVRPMYKRQPSQDKVIPTARQLEENWRKNSIDSSEQNARNNNNSRSTPTTADKVANDVDVMNKNFKDLMKKLQDNNNNNNNDEKPSQHLSADVFLNTEMTCQQLQYQYINLQQQHNHALMIANMHMKTILNRPEALFLLNSLNKGLISRSGLIIQMANIRLPQSDREAISAVISFTSAQQQRMDVYTKMCTIAHQMQNLNNLLMLQQNLAHFQKQQVHAPNCPNSPTSSISSRHFATGESKEEPLTPTEFIVRSGRNLHKMQKMLQLNAAATVQRQQYEQQAASSTAAAAVGIPHMPFMLNGTGASSGLGNVGANMPFNASSFAASNLGDFNSTAALNDLQTQQLLQQLRLPCALGGVNI